MDVHPQYTYDKNGNAVGVFISMEEWQEIEQEINHELPQWQKDALDAEVYAIENTPGYMLKWEDVKKTISWLMVYSVDLSPAAIADLRIAIDYYNSKRENLGNRMAIEVDKILSNISSMPKLYSLRYTNIRAALTPSFPFLIFYKINEKTFSIDVLRIFNTYKKPFRKH